MSAADLDLVVAGGRAVVGGLVMSADIGIRDGRIAAIGERLEGAERIEAAGRLVLPAGIDAHCHVAQESSAGMTTADGYRSASISAAAGGNGTILPFAAQSRGERPLAALDRYAARAEGESVLDWANPLILADPTPEALAELPACFARGVPALKVFLTYDAVRLDDRQFLDVLVAARAAGVLTMVHAENHGLIQWLTERLVASGRTDPKWHASARPAAGEAEAVRRAIALAGVIDAPLWLVHVATAEGAAAVAEARAAGARVWAETCPHYLVLRREALDAGREGAKAVCSPPLRDDATAGALWSHLRRGTFAAVQSDHAGYRFDETGKFFHGPDIPFTRLANGLPGIGARLPVLFSEGVVRGRLSLAAFADLTAGAAARLFGLPRKGALAIGRDADLALWDPEAEWILTRAALQDAMDYSPYEGMRLTGRPETLILRGETVMHRGELRVSPGFGRPLPKGAPDFSDQPGTGAPELTGAAAWGEDLRP